MIPVHSLQPDPLLLGQHTAHVGPCPGAQECAFGSEIADAASHLPDVLFVEPAATGFPERLSQFPWFGADGLQVRTVGLHAGANLLAWYPVASVACLVANEAAADALRAG